MSKYDILMTMMIILIRELDLLIGVANCSVEKSFAHLIFTNLSQRLDRNMLKEVIFGLQVVTKLVVEPYFGTDGTSYNALCGYP